ncbi:MAG: hypothetical protein IT235_06810 [Bacteroidia bacterium]|nr:hypothetical protein [Bacteroidia bacterium]
MKSKVLIVAAYLIIASGTGKLFAQQEFNTCGYAEQLRKLIQKNPTIVTQMDAFQKYQAEYIAKQKVSKMPASQQYIIPVVFHVLHNYGPENITDAQIIQAVSIINRDYNKKNADTISVRSPFNNIIANCDFEFRLARIDPKGNCTNGIEHIQTAQTYMGDDAAKFSQWPRDKYMNIWVSNTLPTAGQAAYAFQPPSVSGISSPLDGIMCLYTYVGDNGTSNPSNSRTLTHELGHSLGLSHTWGNTNNPEVACGDDGIADTPPTQGDNPGCKNPLNFTCSKKTMSKTYTFDSVNVSSGTTDPTPIIPGAVDSTILTFGSFTANNVSVNPTSSKLFEYSGWGTGATDGDTTYANLTGSIDVTKYYEVTLTAKYARAIDLSALNFYFHRSATGPRTFSVRSSRDNYATNLVPTVTGTLISTRSVNTFFSRFDTSLTITGCTVNLPAGYNTNLPLTFRFYGWNAEDIAGSFGIDNVNFVIDG